MASFSMLGYRKGLAVAKAKECRVVSFPANNAFKLTHLRGARFVQSLSLIVAQSKPRCGGQLNFGVGCKKIKSVKKPN